jgi:hypothetical protein
VALQAHHPRSIHDNAIIMYHPAFIVAPQATTAFAYPLLWSTSCILANTPRCAIAEGTRRSCSHSWRVRYDTPSFAADSSRLQPCFVRQSTRSFANFFFLLLLSVILCCQNVSWPLHQPLVKQHCAPRTANLNSISLVFVVFGCDFFGFAIDQAAHQSLAYRSVISLQVVIWV